MNNHLLRVVSIIVVAAAMVAASPGKNAEVPSLAEVAARHFDVGTLEGTSVALADLLGTGKPVVIEFWATWCSPCRKTVPHLVRLQEEYGEDLVVLGLTVEDPEEAADRVRSFVDDYGVNYSIAYAPEDLFRVMNGGQDIAVPKLFVYDRDGRIVSYVQRYSPFTSRRLRSAVKKVVTGASRPSPEEVVETVLEILVDAFDLLSA